MRRAIFFALALASGCTLLTHFDPDGQPCDPDAFDPAQACLSDAGYWCVNGLCKKTGGPPATGGGSAVGGGSATGGGFATGGGSATGGGAGGGGGSDEDAGCDGGNSDSGVRDGGC